MDTLYVVLGCMVVGFYTDSVFIAHNPSINPDKIQLLHPIYGQNGPRVETLLEFFKTAI